MDNELLRSIPKVDELMRDPHLIDACEGLAQQTVTDAVRQVLEELRSGVLSRRVTALPDRKSLCGGIVALARQKSLPSLRSVINGTGIVLHTNLGRACLSTKAAAAAKSVAEGYSTLEYDVATGGRGLRYTHVESLLTKLTGAQSALVVNNNAAAVLLVLSALASGGEVVTSRGELVEIGGAFRIPEIMEACGCCLREVGTTNKTHIEDYRRAIGEETRALMKVHTSNFCILGFTETVPLSELVTLAHGQGLPVIEDLGSGSLCNLEPFGIHTEPTVQASVTAGVDVITFSGDKLLGGPQAGVILSTHKYIQRLRSHPLTRAMRVDKMTLAALEATLRSYVQGEAQREIPTLQMLGVSAQTLHARAKSLCVALEEVGVAAQVHPQEDPVGGGAVPTHLLPGYAVAVHPRRGTVDELEAALRLRERPIVGHIAHDDYLLSVRTLQEADFPALVQALRETAL